MWPRTTAPLGELIVVDDSHNTLAMMSRRLTRMGYDVASHDSGMAALDTLQARRFDLMILDATMGIMSGTACLREVRAMAATIDLPVLMLTARSDPGAAVMALEAGADDYVVKPFDFDVLGARIGRLITRSRKLERLKQANDDLDVRLAKRAVEIDLLRSQLAEAQLAVGEQPVAAYA